MDLVIYTTNYCHYCDILKIIFKIFNIAYIEKNIKDLDDLNFNCHKIPVIKNKDNYILNYNSLNDILNQLDIELLTLDQIYEKLVIIIYSYDNDNINDFWKLFNIKEIQFYVKKGLMLAHHIISADNKILIKYLMIEKREFLNKYLTLPYIINDNLIRFSIPGNQTLLHISAQFNKNMYLKLKNIIEDSEDSIGKKALEYNNNNYKFFHEVNELVRKIHGINYNSENIVIEEYVDNSMKDKIIKLLDNKKYLLPNSMHKTGKYIANDDKIIKQFINDLDNKYNLNLKDKSYNIYSFTAEYGNNKNNNLDDHKDSSIITINWNLEISDDIDGTDLIFTDKEIIVKPKKDQLIIHYGKINHKVSERKNGNRTNLIIWLS